MNRQAAQVKAKAGIKELRSGLEKLWAGVDAHPKLQEEWAYPLGVTGSLIDELEGIYGELDLVDEEQE